MKKKHKTTRHLEYVTVGKKRYNFHYSFAKKDTAIRSIEIIVSCIITFIVITGVYNIL